MRRQHNIFYPQVAIVFRAKVASSTYYILEKQQPKTSRLDITDTVQEWLAELEKRVAIVQELIEPERIILLQFQESDSNKNCELFTIRQQYKWFVTTDGNDKMNYCWGDDRVLRCFGSGSALLLNLHCTELFTLPL